LKPLCASRTKRYPGALQRACKALLPNTVKAASPVSSVKACSSATVPDKPCTARNFDFAPEFRAHRHLRHSKEVKKSLMLVSRD
jgi:hypothetical protein